MILLPYAIASQARDRLEAPSSVSRLSARLNGRPATWSRGIAYSPGEAPGRRQSLIDYADARLLLATSRPLINRTRDPGSRHRPKDAEGMPQLIRDIRTSAFDLAKSGERQDDHRRIRRTFQNGR